MGAIDPASVYNHPDAVAASVALGGGPRAVHRRAGDRQRRALAPERGRPRRRRCTARSASARPSTTRPSAWPSPASTASSSARTPCSASASAPTRPACRWPTSSTPATSPVARSPPTAARSRCATATPHAWGLWHHSLLSGRDGGPEGGSATASTSPSAGTPRSELSWQAHHDALTGLPNRELFLERLSGALRAGAARAWPCCSSTSTTSRSSTTRLGHGAGDRLLSGVAERLCRVLRPGDVIARFGGDEFTVLLPGIASEAYAVQVAERLADALREPLVLDGERRYVTASVGMSFSGARRGRPPRAAARRRRGDVPRQGPGQVALRGLRRLDARARDGAPRARERPAPRARRRRAARSSTSRS